MKKYSLPDMFRLDSKGKIRIRKSRVTGTSSKATWTVETGVLDGKLVATITEYTEGKQGRDAFEQACFEANSAHLKKEKKEKYVEDINQARDGGEFDLMKPMLAKVPDQAKGIIYPAWIQPKLDGNRCMIRVNEKGITKWSRDGNLFLNMEHLDPTLNKMLKIWRRSSKEDLILDGELYTKAFPFKDLNGVLKAPRVDKTTLTGKKLASAIEHETKQKQVQFWWFDIVTKGNFEERRTICEDIACDANLENSIGVIEDVEPTPVVFVDSMRIWQESDINEWHRYWVGLGMEGSIIRNSCGLYEHKRSNNVIKHKDWVDAEFKIIRIDEMDRLKGQGKYVCQGPAGQEFDVTPKCSFEERREIFKHPERYVGKLLTVRYFDTFENGTPRMGSGIRVREEL